MPLLRRELLIAGPWALLPGVLWAQDEVPFITTPDAVTLAMLQLAGVTAADHVIDLGSGDGRIVITAARRFGASGLGVEIVPDLVQQSRANAAAAGVADKAQFRVQDLFATDLAAATVITMYLLPEVNLQLRPRLLALAAGTRIVSHDWDLGDWLPDRSLTLDVPEKAIGRDKRSTVHLWTVPAALAGEWRAGDARLTIVQRFQRFSATIAPVASGTPLAVFDGRIHGRRLQAEGRHEVIGELDPTGRTLRLQRLPPAATSFEGRPFVRAAATALRNHGSAGSA
jgi:SAM-dependent methyltransferase